MSEVEVTKSSPNCGNALLPDALMAPRYKVIDDYPRSNFSVGEIYQLEFKYGTWRHEFYTHEGKDYESESFFTEYPHLFKKLEWWKERKVEEMPKYVKSILNQVHKVERHFSSSWAAFTEYGCTCADNLFRSYSDLQPTTEQEYNAYIEDLKK